MRISNMLRHCTLFVSLVLALAVSAQDTPYDCVSARKLTNKSSVTVDGTSIGNMGSFNEKGSCYTGIERAPYWFTFDVCKTGTLVAYIDPSGTSDFDYVMYDVTAGCGSKVQVACNAQASVGAQNNTGIGCTNGSSCDPEITVIKGHTYSIMFNRYTNNSNAGFTLILGGTCEFSDPSQIDHQPTITSDTTFCGLTGLLSAVTKPTSTLEWKQVSGPGTATILDKTVGATGVNVDVSGIYRFALLASKDICAEPLILSDTVDIEFKPIVNLFGDSTFSICASNTDLIILKDYLKGTPPDGGKWTDLTSTGKIDTNGVFNPYGLGGQQYSFKYTIVPAAGSCIDPDAIVTVIVANELKVVTDSVKCFNSGNNYRVFTHITGGAPGTYKANDNPVSYLFSSGFLPNQFVYNFVITDQSGCGTVTITGTKNCNCDTYSGSLSSTTTFDCASQTVTASHNGNEVLEGGDILAYILYSNPNNPAGSIVKTSSSPSFTLSAPLTADTDYYIAAIAGNTNGGTFIDLNDQCLNISSGVRVRFSGTSQVEISGDTLICEGGVGKLKFNVVSGSNVKITYMANGQASDLFLEPGNTQIALSPIVNTNYVISSASNVFGCTASTAGSGKIAVSIRSKHIAIPTRFIFFQAISSFLMT